jgi:hypothetical protein
MFPQTLAITSTVTHPECLVGRWESTGGKDDLLLRVAVDLYSRWLSDSTYREQAELYFYRHRQDLIGTVGETVGAIFEQISKGTPLEGVAGVIKITLDKLVSANRDLHGDRLTIAPLQIDQAHDLLEVVNKVTNRPIALVVDQWEKSADFEVEIALFDAILRHLEDWPACHIFIGMIPRVEYIQKLTSLQGRFRDTMQCYDLPLMRIDSKTSIACLEYLRAKVPAANAASNEQLIEMISGYPGIIYRWTSHSNADRMTSVAIMAQVARNAQRESFDELPTLFSIPTSSMMMNRMFGRDLPPAFDC